MSLSDKICFSEGEGFTIPDAKKAVSELKEDIANAYEIIDKPLYIFLMGRIKERFGEKLV